MVNVKRLPLTGSSPPVAEICSLKYYEKIKTGPGNKQPA